MAGKTVLHFEKNGKSSGGSLGPHIDREPGKEYSYQHADLSKTKDNIFVQVNKLCLLPYNQAIQKESTKAIAIGTKLENWKPSERMQFIPSMLFFPEATKKCWNSKKRTVSRVDPEEPGILQTGIRRRKYNPFCRSLGRKNTAYPLCFCPNYGRWKIICRWLGRNR